MEARQPLLREVPPAAPQQEAAPKAGGIARSLRNIIMAVSIAVGAIGGTATLISMDTESKVEMDRSVEHFMNGRFRLILAILALGMAGSAAIIAQRRYGLLKRLDLFFKSKEELANVISQLRDSVKTLEEEVAQMRADHIREVAELAESISALMLAHTGRIEALETAHAGEIAAMEKEAADKEARREEQIAALEKTITELREELAQMEEISIEKLRNLQDGSVMVEAKETADRFAELARELLSKMETLKGKGVKDNEFYMIVSVNPDLTGMLDDVEMKLSLLADTWCGENNPEREENAQILNPLFESFDRLKRTMARGNYKDAMRMGFILLGKLELLENMTGEEEEESAETLPDYFAVLEIEAVDKWSPHFADEVKSAYRRLVVIHHPDKNNGEASEIYLQVCEAYQVLYNEDSFYTYIRYQ